jgi:transcriptional regulator with XRE-family HTH domain
MAVPFRPSQAVNLAARRLRAAREALAMQQQDLARACGAEPNRWSNWEAARTLPDPLVIARAMALFGISLDWIYAGDPGHLPVKIFNGIQERYPELLDANPPEAPVRTRRAV